VGAKVSDKSCLDLNSLKSLMGCEVPVCSLSVSDFLVLFFDWCICCRLFEQEQRQRFQSLQEKAHQQRRALFA